MLDQTVNNAISATIDTVGYVLAWFEIRFNGLSPNDYGN